MTTLREAAQQALEFCEFLWREAVLNDYAEAKREETELALRAALAQQTQTPCDIAEDGVCEVIDCCRNSPQILEALEIGYDSAQAEAAQYHAAMAGYRPERHAAMDADVAKIAAAITAVKAALAQEDVAQNLQSRHDAAKLLEERRQEIAQPRREWQGLRNKEIVQIVTDNLTGGDWVDVARAIEAALKEKNA
jgi:hypothetical protein